MNATAPEAERVARLAAELAELARRLAWARHELLSLPIATASSAVPPAPAEPVPPVSAASGTVVAPASAPPGAAVPVAPVPPPVPPLVGFVPAPPVAVPPPTRTQHPARPSDPAPDRAAAGDGLLSSRVLAWVGGSITLIGVVMLLVLAAGRGWFGIPARLVAGALLGAALVGVGRRLHGRPGGEVGSLALVGTGVAALYLDVGVATAGYGYLPVPAGLFGGLVVAGVGLAFADRWGSAQLAGAVLVGAGLFMPAVVDQSPPLLVGMVLVAQAAAVPLTRRRGWPSTAVLAAAFPLLYGSVAAWDSRASRLFGDGVAAAGGRLSAVVAVVAVFLVGTVAAVLTAGRLSDRVVAWLVVSAPLPALQLAGGLAEGPGRAGWPGVVLALLVGLALLAVALVPPGLGTATRTAAGAAGSVAIFQATALWFDGAALTTVLLGQALVLTVVAGLLRRRGPLLAATGYGLAGLSLAVTRDAPISALTHFPAHPYLADGAADRPALVTGLAVSILALLVAVGYPAAAARLGAGTGPGGGAGTGTRALLWVPAGLVALYAAAGTVLTTGLLIAPTSPGFVAAHAVVTVSWTVVALLLLARGISQAPLRVAGMVLVAASVTKLLLFDLVALDGLARVAAFLGAGSVLLTAGSRYARLVARERSRS